MSQILTDLLEEGARLVDSAAAKGVQMRLIGGAAIALSCPDSVAKPELMRRYKDLDLVASRRDSRAVRDLLASQGYESSVRFNALHGSSRLLFYDQRNGRQVDVFVGTFDMCHKLELERRLDSPGRTLRPADLLLLKLQVVDLNEKDLIDALALILQHEPVVGHGAGISVDYIAGVCAADWGWYTSITDNLTATNRHASTVLADPADVETVAGRIAAVLEAMEAAPKSMNWKLRARVGRRMRWYQVPEEVED